MTTLRITEVFYSLQGESTFVGLPTVFVRLTGCPLRCGYCDTDYAFSGGKKVTLDTLLTQVVAFGAQYVCVTGGEPLAQPGCLKLIQQLLDAGYHVSIETSGALDIAPIDSRATIVMDLKTPDSGEASKNRWENLASLKPTDQIKFVLVTPEDYIWAKEQIAHHQLASICQLLFSPSHEHFPVNELADKILADRLPVRLQIQLHKYIWGSEARGR